MEEKNKDQEIQSYKILFNNISNAAWVIDPKNGMIVDVNLATLERYGYTRAELLTMSVYDLDPKDNFEIDKLIKKAKDAGVDNFETTHLTKEKQENPNKQINIKIDLQNKIPTISIEDNAGGIPKTIIDQIFNPYFTTKEQGKGTGIGLYMSMDIMKKSFNGDLLYRATNGGSCFTLVCGGGRN